MGVFLGDWRLGCLKRGGRNLRPRSTLTEFVAQQLTGRNRESGAGNQGICWGRRAGMIKQHPCAGRNFFEWSFGIGPLSLATAGSGTQTPGRTTFGAQLCASRKRTLTTSGRLLLIEKVVVAQRRGGAELRKESPTPNLRSAQLFIVSSTDATDKRGRVKSQFSMFKTTRCHPRQIRRWALAHGARGNSTHRPDASAFRLINIMSARFTIHHSPFTLHHSDTARAENTLGGRRGGRGARRRLRRRC
jgi:hypothetical protein